MKYTKSNRNSWVLVVIVLSKNGIVLSVVLVMKSVIGYVCFFVTALKS